MCRGDSSIIISLLIILIATFLYALRQLIRGIKKNLYEYRNIRLTAIAIFTGITLLWHSFEFIIDIINNYENPLYIILQNIKNCSTIFSLIMFPIACITTVLVTISNIKLVIKEGKSWRNMLGIILGGILCITTTTYIITESSLPQNESISTLIYGIICNSVSISITYLECIILGTILIGFISAKRKPKFNKDYIIILGCKIKKDGTLFPLLKSRVDKAIEFAKLQKEKTGKDIIFVPSGGKGSDEVISEAEAMKNYLLECGIPKNRIIVENKSINTNENIKFSYDIVSKKNKDANIAFSTTNYHVFRAGNIGANQNIYMEGIGAKTKTYYWVNAFVREFIATLVIEKNKHIKTLSALIIISIFITILNFISVVV